VTDYREILRLAGIGLSRTGIGVALGYSRNTIADVLRRAQIKGFSSAGTWRYGDCQADYIPNSQRLQDIRRV